MSKLLEQLINELCPEGVEYIRLKECTEMKRGTSATKKTLSEGQIPVISGGKEPAFYCDTANRYGETITIAGSGAGAGYVQYWNEPIFVNDAFSIKGSKNLNTRYIYHYLLNIQEKIYDTKKGGGVPHVHISSIENFLVPTPPLPVQEEIVRILDKFTELTAELTARKQQYEYYRDNLFVFSDNVLYKPLQEIADIGTGSSNTNEELEIGEYPFFVRSQEVRRKDSYEFDEIAIITSGDGVGVGKIFHYIEGKYALHQRAYRIHINTDDVIPKYYFYYMKSAFLSYIEKNSFHSSVTSIRRPMLNNFPVPIPYPEDKEKSLAEQQHIVDILDRFDKLCNDISEGLPAEIEARQKQYEYYRDKLLTFKKKEATENE